MARCNEYGLNSIEKCRVNVFPILHHISNHISSSTPQALPLVHIEYILDEKQND